MDERTLDTIAKRDELRGLLDGSDAERLVKAARSETLCYDWRPMAATMGLEVGEWE